VLFQEPVGCPFAVRCNYAFERCKKNPQLIPISDTHRVACWWDVAEGRARNV
jgi:oligopeptide transport system ATP-binding protein